MFFSMTSLCPSLANRELPIPEKPALGDTDFGAIGFLKKSLTVGLNAGTIPN